MSKLKACPFCGGEPDLLHGADLSGINKVRVRCTNCLARTRIFSYWKACDQSSAIEIALQAWNLRADKPEEK